MSTLESEVRSVVEGFMNNNELFTALDVSNKVKMALPFARHREVRDIVRGMFQTDIVPAGWARSPITVTLADGTTAEALLYHPLSDSWDLDTKYDDQRRSQGTVQVTPPPVTTTPVVPATVASDGTVTVQPAVTVVPPVTDPATQAVQVQARDRWAQLFSSQPSLFPRK